MKTSDEAVYSDKPLDVSDLEKLARDCVVAGDEMNFFHRENRDAVALVAKSLFPGWTLRKSTITIYTLDRVDP